MTPDPATLNELIAKFANTYMFGDDQQIKNDVLAALRAYAKHQGELSELRELVDDGKAQWDQVAKLLGAEGDDVDDVINKATALRAKLVTAEKAFKETVDLIHRCAGYMRDERDDECYATLRAASERFDAAENKKRKPIASGQQAGEGNA